MAGKAARQEEQLFDILDSPWSRMNNLYWQVDKKAKKFKFVPNRIQRKLYWEMWYLNMVLKARQAGLTTIIQMFLLDRCLFNSDTRAGVIAHNREDAENFFKHKIKYAYDNLPAAIRSEIKARTDRAGELSFSNGSSIRVGTSMRSDTLQYLHISEFGKICARYPDRAAEIISGSLNTIVPGQFIFIESTAEGAYGRFYDMCQAAEKKMLTGLDLSIMDYKFHFFPWFDTPEYVLPGAVPIPEELREYFKNLQADYGIKLSKQQKNWYVKKHEEQGDSLMPREYPSVPEDAFRAIVDGAVFGKEMRKVRTSGRIVRNLPYVEGIPVNTFWDLGRNNKTAIWFHQRVGADDRFIDYHEDNGHNMQHYCHLLMNRKPYLYGTHYMPHDVEQTEYTQSENLTRKEVAQRSGLRHIITVQRIPLKEEAHDLGRMALSSCVFGNTIDDDSENMINDGVKALENYRYEYDEKKQQYSTNPIDNKFAHGADAFMQFAQAYNPHAGVSTTTHTGMY